MAVLAAVVLGKVQALLLGPTGVARYSLLLTVVNLSLIPAAFGMSQALTRLAAGDASDGGPAFSMLRTAAARVRLSGGAIALLVLAVFSAPICSRMLGGQVAPWELWITLASLAFALLIGHDISLLTTAKQVRALAWFTLVDAVAGTGAAMATLILLGQRSVAPSLLAGAAVGAGLSRWAVRRSIPRAGKSDRGTASAMTALLRVGGPYAAAMALGTAVNTSIPLIALHLLGPRAVGYYQVSTAVATGYLMFLVAALSQDYFPRLSAAAPDEVERMVDGQQRLVLTLAMPLILGTIAASPLVLTVGFSGAFSGASEILRWLVLADVLRFLSWTMSFVILARLPMRWFVTTEALGGGTLLASTVLSVHLWGLRGLGIASVATYIVYCGVVTLILHRRLVIRPSVENRRLLLACVITTASMAAVIAAGSEALITVVAASGTVAWAVYAARTLVPVLAPRHLGTQSPTAVAR